MENKYYFFSWEVNEKFDIEQDTVCNMVVQAPCNLDLNVSLKQKWIKVKMNYLFLWKEDNIKGNINVNIENSYIEVSANMFLLLGKNSDINVKGNININPNIEKIKADLVEEALYLDDKAKVGLVPRLNVMSNDVIASHSAKVERLSELSMFYIQSKGISLEEAKKLVISSYINRVLDGYEKLEESVEKYIDYIL